MTCSGICQDAAIASTLTGDYLGDSTGNIDEWSKPSAYEKDLAGTFTGKIYTANGYDPSFRLCSIENWTDEYGECIRNAEENEASSQGLGQTLRCTQDLLILPS